MPQQTFDNLALLSTVRTRLNANANDAESRLTALEFAGVALNTDANTTLTPGRLNHGSIAGYTADRQLIVPAGTAGQEIEVLITAGDDLYEAIIIGASGVSINGGTAATEWSRLFITGEYLRLRCVATNSWWVEVDRRIPQECNMYLAATVNSHFTNDAVVKAPMDTIEFNQGDIASLSNDNATLRRDCRIALSGSVLVTGLTLAATQVIAFASVNSVLYRGGWVSPGSSGASSAVSHISIDSVGVGRDQTVHIAGYQNDGAARAAASTNRYTYMALRELL